MIFISNLWWKKIPLPFEKSPLFFKWRGDFPPANPNPRLDTGISNFIPHFTGHVSPFSGRHDHKFRAGPEFRAGPGSQWGLNLTDEGFWTFLEQNFKVRYDEPLLCCRQVKICNLTKHKQGLKTRFSLDRFKYCRSTALYWGWPKSTR